jgi:NhaP-type Na+/H+ or K+/H+ antiporter/Trk K+ transport system NAD-binding subunit
MADSLLLSIAGLATLGGVCQWLAWRFKLPSILFLLSAGILIGPVFSLFDPDAFLGELLFPFISVSVAIILFEGGLTLKLDDIRGHGAVVTRLITIGVLLTWLLLATAVHLIFDMTWPLSFVFGSIAVVSGPTVIKPLLRTVRPVEKVGHLLNWEGILIDPIGVFLALLVFEYVLLTHTGSGGGGHIALILARLVIVGGALGVAFGFATALVLRRYLVPDYLVNALTLVVVIFVFVLAETLQHESGLLAVTIMGVWLANTRGLHVEEILTFKEDLSVLLISTLFIILAARLDIELIPEYGWKILLLLAIAQFIIRPLNAGLCTIGSELTARERLFLGWIAPRGIVAAAVSSLFVLRLQELEFDKAELLVPLTFSLIIGSVVFQSLTAKPLADRLGISNPEPNGVLFFGANDIALALAAALRQESIKVIISDTSWRGVRLARQAGFEAYHGNPTSGHAEENLDLQGIGKLAAVSSNRDTNALASMHFRSEFGSDSVFTLEGASEDDAYERFDTANRNRANPLFDGSLSYSRLNKLLRDGEIRHVTVAEAVVESDSVQQPPLEQPDRIATVAIDTNSTLADTPVSAIDANRSTNDKRSENDNHSVRDSSAEYTDEDLLLFAIDGAGKLYIYGAGEPVSPRPGWRIIVLVATGLNA